MTTLVFPGQGSQKLGMGQDLFTQYPSYVEKANATLGYDITTLCLEDPNQHLNLTQYTQPALFVVGALSYLNYRQTHEAPTYVAGHSLGEYNALFAANVFDFETGLKLVIERGRLMSMAQEGAMAAIIGLHQEEILELIKNNDSCQGITIANFNTYTQNVITGPYNTIHANLNLFENAGARMVVPLNVSGAFHSHLMEAAKSEFDSYLKGFEYQSPQCQVIANLTAKPYDLNEKSIAEMLSSQMTHSVKWVETIEYLLNQGEDTFTELGHGAVLSGLIKRIKNKQ